MQDKNFSHIKDNGEITMVNVGAKAISQRIAIAGATVRFTPATLQLLVSKALPKGDALACARIGAIMAAKRTSELIPLCHNVPLDFVDVSFEIRESANELHILAKAGCSARTGVEMEAIIAAQTAAAIIYDMCKAVQKDIIITNVRLLYKNGGKSGEFKAPDYSDASA